MHKHVSFADSFKQYFLLSQMQQLETQVLEAERRAYEANQQVNTTNTLLDISSDIRNVKYFHWQWFKLWFFN